MTSVNLISPTGKGELYKVRFKTPLEIEKNSKVYLNFASFTRNQKIFFDTDQTITFDTNDLVVVPNRTEALFNTVNSNKILETNGITIPKKNSGTGDAGYTVTELREFIQTEMNKLQKKNDNSKSIFYNYEFIGTDTAGTSIYKNKIPLGWILNDDRGNYTPVTLRANIGLGGGTQIDAQGENFTYVKTSDTAVLNQIVVPVYDNFGISNEVYNHNQALSNTDNIDKHNIIIFKTATNIDDMGGCVSLGLIPSEVLDGTWSTWTNRPKGQAATNNGGADCNPPIYVSGRTKTTLAERTAATRTRQGKLGAFLEVQITDPQYANEVGTNMGRRVRISVARNTNNDVNLTTGTFKNTKMDFNVVRMIQVASFSLDKIMNNVTSRKLQLGLQMYFDSSNNYWGNDLPSARRWYYRLYNFTDNLNVNSDNIIFDSRIQGHYLTGTFFNMDFVDNQGIMGSIIKAQRGFNLIMSAQAKGDGFENVTVKQINREDATNNSPTTQIQRYSMSFSSELAGYVGTAKTELLSPNTTDENPQLYYLNELLEEWNNRIYSIYLKGLPITNYKNVEDEEKSGYSKPIIYDVPAPYSNVNTDDSTGGTITGVFQPNFPKILNLRNNKIIINEIDVEIRNGYTDRIIKGLEKSVINFTIQE